MKRVKGDPHWITAEFRGCCSRCDRDIQPGEQAFYFPHGKGTYCADDACGQQESRDFEAASADEEFGL